VLDSFVTYHRAIGFEHLFLFFDDPADPDLARAGAMRGVTAIPHDTRLQAIWRGLPGYRRFGASITHEVMSRQLLNVEYAMHLARERGFGWLLHIDSDELFFAPSGNIGEHFAGLSATTADTVTYLNCEAVPERETIGDFFREVDLFKRPLKLVEQDSAMALAETQRDVPQLRPFFHFYANGKSAVRLTATPPAPVSVHLFRHTGRPTAAATSRNHFVLHYACCGFDTFWTKYVALGRFSDRWWGEHDIASAIGRFHLDARDVVTSGSREDARTFYRERCVLADPARADALICARLLARFDQPRTIIEEAIARTASRSAPASASR